MNGVQATVLAATAAPAEAGVASANQNSKRVRDFSPTRSSFEKQLKKAFYAQKENLSRRGMLNEPSVPVKPENSMIFEDVAVEQVKKEQLTDTSGDERENEGQAGGANPQTGTTTVKTTVMQLELQGNTADLSKRAALLTQAGDALKKDTSNREPAVNHQTEVFTFQTKMKVDDKVVPVGKQIQNDGKLEASQNACKLQVEVLSKDDGDFKKTAEQLNYVKLSEFESRRASVVHFVKDHGLSKNQERFLSTLSKIQNIPVLQQSIQEGVIGKIKGDSGIPEVRAINTVADLSKSADLPSQEESAGKIDSLVSVLTGIPRTAGSDKVVPVEAQIHNWSKSDDSQEMDELQSQVQIKDELNLWKTDEANQSGRNRTEVENQRVTAVRTNKDSSSSPSEDQSFLDSEKAQNSLLLQEAGAQTFRVQVRDELNPDEKGRVVVDPQDLMNQVVKKAAVLIKDNRSEMTLQLKPGFLGRMTIKIAVDEAGTVTAHFSTSSQQVKNALEQNILTLRHTLEAQGLKVDRTEVNVQLDSGGMMSDPGGRQDLWQQPRGGSFTCFSDSDGDTSPAASQRANPVPTGRHETAETGAGYNFLV